MSNEVSLAEAQGPLTEAMQQFSGQENGRQRFEEFKLWLKSATAYLRRLFVDVVVAATNGTESMPGLSPSGHATPATKASVWVMILDGLFAQLFGSLGKKRIRWSNSQVAIFCRDNPSKLRGGGYGNFFELEDGSVAFVFVLDGGQPRALVYKFSNDHVWDAEYESRVFSLQQAA